MCKKIGPIISITINDFIIHSGGFFVFKQVSLSFHLHSHRGAETVD
jgi:hypothetical protein